MAKCEAIYARRPYMIVAAVFFLSCGGNPEKTAVSLMDSPADAALTVPWILDRWSGWLGGIARSGEGLDFRGGKMVQASDESLVRFPVDLEGRGCLMVHLSYASEWEDGTIEVQVIQDDILISTVTEKLLGRNIIVEMDASIAGVVSIELRHHIPIGTPIPLLSVTTGEIYRTASEMETDQLRLVLEWVGEPTFDTRPGLPESRRFQISADGCTKDCLLLGDGRSINLKMPTVLADRKLRFWYRSLVEPGESTPLLYLEAKTGHDLVTVDQWQTTKDETWHLIEVEPDRLPGQCEGIRFSFVGESSLLCIADPVLLPTGSPGSKWNLVLIFLDTVRADRLGSYGYSQRPTSARLDSVLTARGFTIFENAYAPAPWTLSSAAKFLTSRYLHADLDPHIPIIEQPRMLAEIMRKDGYYCAAFTGGGLLRTPGFERGFHEFHWSHRLGKTEESFPQAISWLKNRSEPFFLLVHTYEAHQPYIRTTFCDALQRGRLRDPADGKGLLPAGWKPCTTFSQVESLYVEALYDGGIREATDATADLCEQLESLDLFERTIVVVLSDHGEEFWDHFDIYGDHSHSLYGELLHVPFCLYHPGMRGPRRIETSVSLVDLVPTVAGLLDLPVHDQADGVDLAPLLNGETISRSVPILASLSNSMNWEGISMYHEDKKYIEITSKGKTRGTRGRDCVIYPEGRELYHLDVDPREKIDLCAKNPDELAAMAESLQSAIARAQKPITSRKATQAGTLTPELRNQLAVLGYVD